MFEKWRSLLGHLRGNTESAKAELIKAKEVVEKLLERPEKPTNLEMPSIVAHDNYGFDHFTVLERSISILHHPVNQKTVAILNSYLDKQELWNNAKAGTQHRMRKNIGFVLDSEYYSMCFRVPDNSVQTDIGESDIALDTASFLRIMHVDLEEKINNITAHTPKNLTPGSLGK